MRTVSGAILLPPQAAAGAAKLILIEVRDISLADAPSVVVAELRLRDVALGPGRRIPFSLAVPEVEPSRSLALRVHIDRDADGRVSPGDLLTTTIYPIPPRGAPPPLSVAVSAIGP